MRQLSAYGFVGAPMCIFICANPKVHDWFDVVAARTTRHALQLSALCPRDPYEAVKVDTTEQLDEAAVLQLARGPKLRQPSWPRSGGSCSFRGERSSKRKHPLDALANAWSRLLFLIRWR